MLKPLIILAALSGLAYIMLTDQWELFSEKEIQFLDKDTVQRFILEDKDRYIRSMSHYDILARNAKNHKQYLLLSSESSLDFSINQQIILEKAVNLADDWLRTLNHPAIQYKPIPWKFALALPTYEEGLPHTREGIIFLYPKHLNLPTEELVKLLIHEWVHVYQRKYLSEFQRFLTEMGYIPWRKRSGYPRIRANPDLDDTIYINPSGEVMLTVYSNETPTSINDVSSPNSLSEHPFEEIAYAIAGLKR